MCFVNSIKHDRESQISFVKKQLFKNQIFTSLIMAIMIYVVA